MKAPRAPLILAIFLLLLPVLYVGSYLALVVPAGRDVIVRSTRHIVRGYTEHYRLGGDYSAKFFWPLEQIDRKVRPGSWGPPAEPIRPYRALGEDGLERIGVDFK